MDLKRWSALLTVLSLALSGCKEQKSTSTGSLGGEPIPTRSMYMHTFVEARDETEVRVISVLTKKGDALIDKGSFDLIPEYPEHDFILDGGDTMQACLASNCVPMEKVRLVAAFDASEGGYRYFFPLQANTTYTVKFIRPNAVSASGTTAQVPSPITLSSPYMNQIFGDGEQILVAWSPAGLENIARINARINCTTPDAGPGTYGSAGSATWIKTFPTHNGSVTIAVDELVSLARSTQSGAALQIGSCHIFLGVAHERSGTVDTAFRGGESVGRYWTGTRIEYRH